MQGSYRKFYNLYTRLRNLHDYIEYKQESEEAIMFYNKTVRNKENENRIIYWLVKYEELGNENLYNLMEYFKDEEQVATGFVPLHKDYNLLIDIKDFESHVSFIKLFESHYPEMLKKYNTLTEEEKNKILEEDGDEGYFKIHSLKYHLDRKKRE